MSKYNKSIIDVKAIGNNNNRKSVRTPGRISTIVSLRTKLNRFEIEAIERMRDAGMHYSIIHHTLGYSMPTIYKYAGPMSAEVKKRWALQHRLDRSANYWDTAPCEIEYFEKPKCKTNIHIIRACDDEMSA